MEVIEKTKEYDRQRRIDHRERGLCLACSRPAVENMCGYCALHYDHRLRHNREYLRKPAARIRRADYMAQRRYRLKSEHKCVSCAMPLGDYEGTKCFNCSTVSDYGAIKGVL